ncbi:MAG TPA: histidine phosphatase family protein [Trebonia sp.]|nr:histidine phosphatase family protein [Trebonia sp.]
MRLLLVRHGQTHSNIAHALDTAYPGAELTDLGRRQAQLLAASLADETIHVVAASTLLRAQQTAAPAAEARGLPVMTLEGLCEIGAGDLEMNSDRDSIDTYRKVMTSWSTGELAVEMPGGTSGHEFLSRFDGALQSVEDISQALSGGAATALVVSHGSAIRTWVATRCAGVDAADMARTNLVNTGMFIIEGSSRSRWRLERRIDPIEDSSPVPA